MALAAVPMTANKINSSGAENAAAQKRTGSSVFTPDRIRRYFRSRLRNEPQGPGPQVNVRCPFHDDRKPSMSLNLNEGSHSGVTRLRGLQWSE